MGIEDVDGMWEELFAEGGMDESDNIMSMLGFDGAMSEKFDEEYKKINAEFEKALLDVDMEK